MLPANKTEAQWLARRAKSFIVIKGELYKRRHTRILQRCIPTEQGKDLLEDIHGGVKAYNEQGNEASLEDTMDLLDEAHDIALLCSAKYQQAL